MFDSAGVLNTALQHHQRGEIATAEQLYRQILAYQPQHVDALTLLGAACIGQGRAAEAIECLSAACRLNPQHAAAHDNLGVAYAKLRRFADAQRSFEHATRLNPHNISTWINLGNALAKQGQLAGAIGPLQEAVGRDPHSALAHYELAGVFQKLGQNEPAAAYYARCVELQPGNIIAHFNRGMALSALGRRDESRAAYERALSLKPDHPETLVNLGNELIAIGRHAEAIERLERALALRPNFAEACINLGNALTKAARYDEAIAVLRRATELNPQSSEACNNLGNALVKRFEYPAAVAAYEQALRLKPDDPEPRYNLGSTYYRLREPQRAIVELNRALELRPTYAEARYARAVSWLLLGDFANGWADYEARWQCPEFKPRRYQQPLWDGSPLAGKRILLFAEQGLGDTLQFIRYSPLIKRLGGTTIVEVHKPLLKLLAAAPGVDELRPLDSGSTDFDVYASLMSLPGILATDQQTIPRESPYLFADEGRVEHWRRELDGTRKFRVGLAWQGNPIYPDDRLRSIPLRELTTLLGVPGVEFVSLQKGPGSEQLGELASGTIRELGSSFDESAGPFVDTAAVMMNLDLVITSDTAVAHLAGALARPLWIMLPFAPDWRWLLDRTDSPWYPSARLFRPPAQGDWRPVVEEIEAALRQLVAGPT